MKSDADEKKLLESVERGEWKSAGGKRERTRFSGYAKATFKKAQEPTVRLARHGFEEDRAVSQRVPLAEPVLPGTIEEIW